VQLAEGDRVFLEGLVVDGDAEGDSDFVGAGVAFSDGLSGVVDLAGDQVSFEFQSCVGKGVLMSAMMGWKRSSFCRGRMETFTGAILGLRQR
jgi:hypothetical protein